MAQIVEMQILDPRGLAGLAPVIFQAVLRDREDQAAPQRALERLSGALRY